MPPEIRPPLAADVELLVINWLNTRPDFTAMDEVIQFSDDVPYFENMAANAAYGRVTKSSGPVSKFVQDAVIDIDIFSMNKDLTISVARITENLMLYGLFGTRHPEGGVQGVREDTGPHWIPDENQDLTRYSATYVVRAR
jgi:hypothetical protein